MYLSLRERGQGRKKHRKQEKNRRGRECKLAREGRVAERHIRPPFALMTTFTPLSLPPGLLLALCRPWRFEGRRGRRAGAAHGRPHTHLQTTWRPVCNFVRCKFGSLIHFSTALLFLVILTISHMLKNSKKWFYKLWSCIILFVWILLIRPLSIYLREYYLVYSVFVFKWVLIGL